MQSAALLTENFTQFLKKNETTFQPLNETLVQFELELMEGFSESIKTEDESFELESLECAFLATPLDETRGLLVLDAKLPFEAPEAQVQDVVRFASQVNTRLIWTFLVFHEPQNVLTCRINSPATIKDDIGFLAEEMTGALSATSMLVLPALINLLLAQTTALEAVNRVDAQMARMQDNL